MSDDCLVKYIDQVNHAESALAAANARADAAERKERNMVTVMNLGKGKVVSNWGTYAGKPAVFIEPVLEEPGDLGENVSGDREPQIKSDAVSDGGVVIVIHDVRGAEVFLEDFRSAMAHVVPGHLMSYDEKRVADPILAQEGENL